MQLDQQVFRGRAWRDEQAGVAVTAATHRVVGLAHTHRVGSRDRVAWLGEKFTKATNRSENKVISLREINGSSGESMYSTSLITRSH